MTSLGASSPEASAYSASVEVLARRVLDGLRTVQGTPLLRAHLDSTDDEKTALAAVRVTGPDVFLPQMLRRVVLPSEDAAAIAAAFEVFPSADAKASASAVSAWRDWATGRLLAWCGGDELGFAQPSQDAALESSGGWRDWSVRMAQLAPLALPGLDGPVREMASSRPVALAQGVTRSLLRGDHPTAARLVRWLAWAASTGADLPLDPRAVTEHLRLVGGGARLTLDLTVTEHLLEMRPE